MKLSGYAIVVGSYVSAALIAVAIIKALGADARDFALIAGTVVATQVGATIWFKQAPETPLMRVKLLLGTTLALSALVFGVIFQALTGWFEYPEIIIPIATIGSFLFPLVTLGAMWKGLAQAKAKAEAK